jgi:hypothetical protein
MHLNVEIGNAEAMRLWGCLMVFRGRSRAYCAWHEVVTSEQGAPCLGHAQALSTDFV